VGRFAAPRLKAGARQGKIGAVSQGVTVNENQRPLLRFIGRVFGLVGHGRFLPVVLRAKGLGVILPPNAGEVNDKKVRKTA
jgi:hypothetical protein